MRLIGFLALGIASAFSASCQTLAGSESKPSEVELRVVRVDKHCPKPKLSHNDIIKKGKEAGLNTGPEYLWTAEYLMGGSSCYWELRECLKEDGHDFDAVCGEKIITVTE